MAVGAGKVVGSRCPLGTNTHPMLPVWPTTRSISAVKIGLLSRLGRVLGPVAQKLDGLGPTHLPMATNGQQPGTLALCQAAHSTVPRRRHTHQGTT